MGRLLETSVPSTRVAAFHKFCVVWGKGENKGGFAGVLALRGGRGFHSFDVRTILLRMYHECCRMLS